MDLEAPPLLRSFPSFRAVAIRKGDVRLCNGRAGQENNKYKRRIGLPCCQSKARLATEACVVCLWTWCLLSGKNGKRWERDGRWVLRVCCGCSVCRRRRRRQRCLGLGYAVRATPPRLGGCVHRPRAPRPRWPRSAGNRPATWSQVSATGQHVVNGSSNGSPTGLQPLPLPRTKRRKCGELGASIIHSHPQTDLSLRVSRHRRKKPSTPWVQCKTARYAQHTIDSLPVQVD
jgi:hypothetical protein